MSFVLLDGIDGSGKTTQTELLVSRLKKENYPVEMISFPQYGAKSAGPVEEYLNGRYGSAEEVGPYRASILYAVDRYAAAPRIRDWLAQGKIVIANRYVASNMGHQGGKIKDPAARKRFFEWNDHLEYNIFGIPRPDLNIILHVPAELAQRLVDKKGHREYVGGVKRDIHENDLRHLQEAEAAYLEIARSFPNFVLVECVEDGQMLAPEVIHERIWGIIKNLKFKI